MPEPYGEVGARAYEADAEHAMVPGEAELWLSEIASDPSHAKVTSILDVGAGTGLLTLVLKRARFDVVGLEPSETMIEQGCVAPSELDRSDFVLGHGAQSDLFPAGRFDWIVSRQTLCHLANVKQAFAVWRRWLVPGGRLLLVDGFWRPGSWSASDRARQPFACLTDTRPLEATLIESRFEIERAGPFEALDALRQAHGVAAVPRYRVRARATLA